MTSSISRYGVNTMYRENKGKTGVKNYKARGAANYGGFCWRSDVKQPSDYFTHVDCIGDYRADATYKGYAYYQFSCDGWIGGAPYCVHADNANALFMDGHVNPVNRRSWSPDYYQECVDTALVEYNNATGAVRDTIPRP